MLRIFCFTGYGYAALVLSGSLSQSGLYLPCLIVQKTNSGHYSRCFAQDSSGSLLNFSSLFVQKWLTAELFRCFKFGVLYSEVYDILSVASTLTQCPPTSVLLFFENEERELEEGFFCYLHVTECNCCTASDPH